MKAFLFILIGIVVSFATHAESAANLIAQARGLLVQKDLPGAKAKAEAALALEAKNFDANAMVAFTRLLVVVNSPQGTALLDRLGFDSSGRNAFFWTSKRGTDPVPSNFTATEITDFSKKVLIPALRDSDANLAKITDTNYVFTFTDPELGFGSADFADFQVTRALFHAAQFFFHTLASWNLDAQFGAVESYFSDEHANSRNFLAANPQFLTFANNADLIAARAGFQTAIQFYLDASARIRARTSNELRFFNLGADSSSDEQNFQKYISDLRASLRAPVVLATETNLTVHLGRFFNPTTAPRAWLPTVQSGVMIGGTIPDPSFGGIFGGMSNLELESKLEEFIRFGTDGQLNPATTSRLTFQTVLDNVYAIEQSTDLEKWVEIASFHATSDTYLYDAVNHGEVICYYRLREQYFYYPRFSGTVIDACSGLPVRDAIVSAEEYPTTAITDTNGRFSIQHPPDRWYSDPITVRVKAPGYSTNLIKKDFYDFDFGKMQIALFPNSSSRPANDNFNNRINLPPLFTEVTGTTCGATKEPGELPGGNSVWYQWTSPFTGFLILESDWRRTVSQPRYSVFKGNSLSSLTPVSNSVIAGTTYQIRIDTVELHGLFVAYLRRDSFGSFKITQPQEGQEFKAGRDIVVRTLWDGDLGAFKSGTLNLNGTEILITNSPNEHVLRDLPPGSYRLSTSWTDWNGGIEGGMDSTSFRVTPINDDFADRSVLSGVNWSVFGSTSEASSEIGEPSSSGDYETVWFTWKAPSTGTFTLFTSDQDNYHALDLFAGSTIANLTPIPSISSRTDGDQLSFNAISGVSYHFRVRSLEWWWGDEKFMLTLAKGSAPVIKFKPLSKTSIKVGESIDVSVEFSHSAGLVQNLSLTDGYKMLSNISISPTANGTFTWRYKATTSGLVYLEASALDSTGLLGVAEQEIYVSR